MTITIHPHKLQYAVRVRWFGLLILFYAGPVGKCRVMAREWSGKYGVMVKEEML